MLVAHIFFSFGFDEFIDSMFSEWNKLNTNCCSERSSLAWTGCALIHFRDSFLDAMINFEHVAIENMDLILHGNEHRAVPHEVKLAYDILKIVWLALVAMVRPSSEDDVIFKSHFLFIFLNHVGTIFPHSVHKLSVWCVLRVQFYILGFQIVQGILQFRYCGSVQASPQRDFEACVHSYEDISVCRHVIGNRFVYLRTVESPHSSREAMSDASLLSWSCCK
mmetsp:Transcript_12316/g.30332  ORF Transcript_12316/g.30332 Transcript_12316/m.30332 type:complete len:221 (+) Transcript_12316:1048-1710(+)